MTEGAERTDENTTRRFRLFIGCLVLTALAFVQQPGRVVADTKLDLVVDPLSFLARAVTMWDAEGFFGQVQNQAYGYLFPMGPFFLVGDLAQVDPWIIQRLWWALVMCVAFTGFVTLCRVLRIGSPRIQLLGGLLFALSPRFLTVLGPSSIETWPSALAPWVLVPLVIGLERGSPRRQAALSALAIACVGGVNAVATFAVVPLAGLWLLMAARGPRRRALLVWWPPLVLLGTAWWMVPLFLLGAYSPPFLDYIESSAVTTTAATVADALRGTSNWVPYISDLAVAGRSLISDPIVMMNVGVVVVLGIVGLTLRDLPHRAFLVVGVLSGLGLVTLGHTGSVQGWGAQGTQDLLDSVLAPLRNTHKFDVVIRLPLVLAAVHAVAVLRRAVDDDPRETTIRRAAVALVTVTALVGSASPLLTGQLANARSIEALPEYWEQTARSLAENDSGGVALLVPASGFADYLWGSTGDEPMQPLAESAWAVRNSVPLTRGATIRLLDSITDQLESGDAAPRIARTLRRAGVDRLVVRNDLRADVAGDRVEAVRQALSNAKGLSLAASFGPELGGVGYVDLGSERTFSQGGWQTEARAVEVYAVAPAPGGRYSAVERTPTVLGASDTVATLDELGVIGAGPVVLAQDRPARAPRGPVIVTDGLRRQEFAFGAVSRGRSATLERGEKYTLDRAVHDYVEEREASWTAEAQLEGAVGIDASSARSGADAPGGARPSLQPFSAFDGDARSRWEATGSAGSLEVRLRTVRDLGRVTIRSGVAPGVRQDLIITTENGPQRVSTTGAEPRTVRVGTVGVLSIRGANSTGGRFSIAEVTSPGLDLARPLVVPAPPAAWGVPETIVLGAAAGRRSACLVVDSGPRCRAGVEERGEDAWLVDRRITMPGSTEMDLEVRTRPVAGSVTDSLLQSGLEARISTSSSVSQDVRSSASMLADGDGRTAWIAHPDDADPTITVTWDEPVTFSSLRLPVATGTPASRPAAVTMEVDGGRLVRAEFDGATARFDRVTTNRVALRLESAEDARDFVGDSFASVLPVGAGEIDFNTAPVGEISDGRRTAALPCGSGPFLTVDGAETRTAVVASRADLLAGREVVARPCGNDPLWLDRGSHRLELRASEGFEAGRAILQRRGATPTAAAGTRYVLEKHNANPGWTAVVNDDTVKPVVLNGWQQGWVLPATVGDDVVETFAPGPTFRAALLGGAGAFALLLLIALFPARRRFVGDVGVTRTSLPHGAVVGAVGAAGLVLLGGTPFLVLGAVALLVVPGLAKRGVHPAWLAAGAVMVATAWYVVLPWGGASWAGSWQAPQLAVGLALSVVVVATARDLGLSRRKGRST